MKRGSLVTLIAGGAAVAAAIASSSPAHAERGDARITSRITVEPLLTTTIDVRARVLDHDRLREDPTTRGRRHFDYLAWLPAAESTSVELDPRPVLRQLFGRRIVAEEGFNVYILRGSHLFSAELGSTRIGIAPNGFSLQSGTTLTLASVF